MANKEELRMLCKKLNLVHLAKIGSFDLEIKKKDDYLKYLLEYEINERKKSVHTKNKKSSRIPTITKPIKYTGIDKWNVDDLKSLSWLESENNLMIVGKCGKGKTQLASELGNIAIEKGFKVYYLKQEELLTCLNEKESSSKQQLIFNKLKDADLIILDEMMYLPVTSIDVITLYRGIMYLNDSRSFIFITNRRLEEWLTITEDKHTMETFVSRITLNARQIVFK